MVGVDCFGPPCKRSTSLALRPDPQEEKAAELRQIAVKLEVARKELIDREVHYRTPL